MSLLSMTSKTMQDSTECLLAKVTLEEFKLLQHGLNIEDGVDNVEQLIGEEERAPEMAAA
jgi:hypothetical protein